MASKLSDGLEKVSRMCSHNLFIDDRRALTSLVVNGANGVNGINGHGSLAAGQAQDADKEEGDSDDEKEDGADAGGGAVNGGKQTLSKL